jgi:hypothetical protein
VLGEDGDAAVDVGAVGIGDAHGCDVVGQPERLAVPRAAESDALGYCDLPILAEPPAAPVQTGWLIPAAAQGALSLSPNSCNGTRLYHSFIFGWPLAAGVIPSDPV